MLTCSLSLNGPSRGSGAATQGKQSLVTRIASTFSYQTGVEGSRGRKMVERREEVKTIYPCPSSSLMTLADRDIAASKNVIGY